MSKLRVVKERKERTDDFDQDLRGLGGSDLLANEYPWVFLSIKGTPNDLQKTCDLLGLKAKPGKEHGVLHLFKPGKGENHKEKAIALFGASVLLANSDPNIAMCLGQVSVLAQRMQGVELKDIYEEDAHDYENWHKLTGLSSSEMMRVYLKHSGIELNSALTNANTLIEIVRNENSQQSMQSGIKKIS